MKQLRHPRFDHGLGREADTSGDPLLPDYGTAIPGRLRLEEEVPWRSESSWFAVQMPDCLGDRQVRARKAGSKRRRWRNLLCELWSILKKGLRGRAETFSLRATIVAQRRVMMRPWTHQRATVLAGSGFLLGLRQSEVATVPPGWMCRMLLGEMVRGAALRRCWEREEDPSFFLADWALVPE